MKNSELRICVMAGDGIGVEVMAACRAVLDALTQRFPAVRLGYEEAPAGAFHYRDSGEALPEDSFRKAEAADAILFGAMGWPEIRYPDGTEIAPQLDLRVRLGLFAGVRPAKAYQGMRTPLADPRAAGLDLVVVRESTEGLFASRGKGRVEDDRTARETMVITRETSERLFDFSFRLAERRKARGGKGRLTCVDKSNVFAAFAFFRKVFDERSRAFPGIEARHHYIDATALDLVRKPWEFDVLVTENMFGDILSDLAAGLIGGMGMAPSADIGERHAVFQPCHGSAPDIAGKGLANPTAMFLSAAMMLDWLAQQHGHEECAAAGAALEAAVEAVYAEGRIRPPEYGGADGTAAITRAVIAALGRAEA
jgi:3-isopropylmalate dehydrogenase